MNEDLQLGVLSQQDAAPTGMIEVNVRQQQRRHVGNADPGTL
jgi:hypothetical protein